MKVISKKILSIFLAVVMILTMVPLTVFSAASKPTVKIISFMRGEQSDLRSSELLEAHVEGYDGNVLELTYKWYNSLGTYLYVYNSHNMYHINNTDGEIEVYNSSKQSPLSNMIDRSFPDSFAGAGYAWASVYGANIGRTSLQGTVTVEVIDKNGNVLCSDSHTGTGTNNTRKGFVAYNLDQDMDNVVIGIFEGEKKNVKDLLGESAIVHITCVESTVANGKIISGSDHIKLTKESDGDYYITGTAAGTSTTSDGDAKVELDIKKGNCKFHNATSGDAVTTAFVFKKPVTDTTTTTLTLTGDLDARCEYFIDGVQGTKQSDGTIIFTGLTPNTAYTVEVRGEYKDNNGATKYAYAYVYDTTKPVYQATVYTYLDGALTDISDIHGDDVTLYLHEDKENAEYIELTKNDIGTYAAAVENGIYFPWHIEAGDHYHQAREYKLIIENANGKLNLHHYSVTYDTNGGAFKDGETVEKEVFSSGAAVIATNNIPVLDGYVFAGWKYDDNTYASGAKVTSNITSPITLTARWEKEVNVTINVTIDHRHQNGYDHNETKDELTVDFLEMTKDSPAFTETGDKLFFTKEGVSDENGNSKAFEYSAYIQGEAVLETKYTATAPTYTGLLESSTFGVALSKSGYDVGVIEKIIDEDGNWIINIPLTYNPDDFDIEFSVKMAEDVPTELYPDAVIVKIACWDADANNWVIISQQRTTENTVRPGVRVDINKATGEGFGSYPVWKNKEDGTVYGYRAVVTGFIYGNSTIIVPTEKDHTKEDGKVIITYTDGNYTATMGEVADGQKFSTSLNGAYYNESTNAQQGTLDGVITVEKYNVIFDAQGGTINDCDKYTETDQYYVPELDGYLPVMEEHTFNGWYLDKECTIPATEGELLVEDITLYAKWDTIITGTLIVDGYFDTDHIVNQSDRATYALVEFEEITPDGTYNIAGTTVEIQWVEGKHFSEAVPYKFTGLDADKTYRLDVYLINYEASYQNSTTVINGNGDIHDDYNLADFTAIYPEDSKWETFVNTFLHFAPESYFQPVEVDATRIGEGFRPYEILVEYLGKEVGTDNDYGIIIQHEVEPFGVEVGMAEDGRNDGIYGCEIWKKIFNGNLYDYQANLTKINGTDLNQWPVIISYGNSVRWSPYNQAPTDSLKVTIIPMWYAVVYDWNTEDNYAVTDTRGHVWSHESAIDYSEENIPTRDGYTFGGWYANAECTGEKIVTIPAAVHEDTTVYAKWIPNEYSYTVNYLEDGTDKVLSSSKTAESIFGEDVTETAIEIPGYSLVGNSSKTIKIDTENNVINFYYTVNSYGYTVNYLEEGTNKVLSDVKNAVAVYGEKITEAAIDIEGYVLVSENTKAIDIAVENNVINFFYAADAIGGGENGEDSDAVPDKYQKKVVFEVINGKWSDDSTEDIVTYLTLMTDSQWDVNGTAVLEAPYGMEADEGFENGYWVIIPPAIVSGTDEVKFTYIFTEITTPDTPDNPDEPDEPDNPDIPVEPDTPDVPVAPGGNEGSDSTIKHHIVFGKTDGIGWYRVSKDGGQTFDLVFGNSTYEVENGTQIIVKVGDLTGDAFRFYVNGKAVEPDENGNLVVTVDGYMLIGALGYKIQIPDIEESLNWFQRIIKAIKDFFAKLFGW